MDVSFLDQSLWLRALIGAGLGLVIGSFLATVRLRWPAGRSVLGGRSACDSCGAPLGALELVPVLSYLVQRGRCRRCGAAIDKGHPAIELTAGLVGAVALVDHPGALGLVTAALGWWLLLIAILDLEHHWLPDRLTLPLAVAGLLAAWAGVGPPLWERAAGAAIGWGALVLIAAGYKRLRGREGLGGGDPLLLGALGAWLGAWHLPLILLGAGLVGLAMVAALRLRGARVDAATRLPFGTLMALAAWPLWLVVAIQPTSIFPSL